MIREISETEARYLIFDGYIDHIKSNGHWVGIVSSVMNEILISRNLLARSVYQGSRGRVVCASRGDDLVYFEDNFGRGVETVKIQIT